MSIQPYTGRHLAPGEYTPVESFENEFVGGRWENHHLFKGLMLSSTVDSGHTGYTTTLRSGVLLGKVTASDKMTVWNPAGTDGSEDLWGILKSSLRMTFDTTAVDRLTGPFIAGGVYDPNKIIRSASTSTGIVGDTYEYQIRKLLAGQGFKSTDALWEVPYGVVRKDVAKTDDYTVLASDRNVRFTNAGASGAVNFTLPATASAGLEYWFFVAADQTLTVTAGTADTMIVFNDIAADSVSYGTSSEKVGGAFHIKGNGSKWEVETLLAADSQTVTIVTA